MFFRLFLLFTLVPVIEIYLLLQLGHRVGAMPTVLLVIGTGALGAWLARQQGLRTWLEARDELAVGRLPTSALIDGILILVAGAVLLTPGLLTDLCGFALLTPAIRRAVRGWLTQRFRRGLDSRQQVIIVDSREISGD